MTPTPGGQPNTGTSSSRFPKFQPNQQPGNEPGGANGMYGRFGQTPGQQPSQGFRQKVDGMRRGFGSKLQPNGGNGQASGMGPATGDANARQADRSQDQGQASSYRTSGQYDRDRAGGMQDNDVAERETGFNSDPRHAQNAAMGNRRLAEQPMQQPDYGRFAPGPAADAPSGDTSAQQQQASGMSGGDGQSNAQQAAGSQDQGREAYSQQLRSLQQPQDQANAQQARWGVDSAGMSSPFGRFQPQPSPADASPSQQPSGSFASPFGMMRSNMPAAPVQQPANYGRVAALGGFAPGAPPAQSAQQPTNDGASTDPAIVANREARRAAQGAPPTQPNPDDTQPRDTFQTGQSSLTQPLHSLEGQSRRRQRDRFGYGA